MSTNAAVEPSCWEEAISKLKCEHPKLYKRLEEIRATQPQSSPDSLAESLLAVIEAKRKILENNELPLPFNIRNSDVKTRIKRALDIIWKAVQVFKTAGDVVTNIDPLHAGVAWSGVNIILQMALTGAEQNTAALEGLAHISPLVARYAKIEELYIRHRNTKLDKAFKARLVDLYVAILQYQVSVAHHCQRNKFVQYARALPIMDDWKALLQDIVSKDADCRKFTEVFDSEDQKLRHSELQTSLQKLQNQMDAISCQIDGEHEKQGRRAASKEQEDILNWISDVSYREDHRMTLENGKLEQRYANSGQWLFRHSVFQKWSSSQDENTSTICLYGPAGTGKSSLVCLVIEHFLRDIQSADANKEQLAYFYCSKKQGQAEGSDPKTILRSLMRQLAWSADNLTILKPIKDIYDERQVSLTVSTCTSLLTKIVSTRQNTTIVIDALDECSDPLELLSNLNEISVSAKSNIRFFFSTRMNVDVGEEFPRYIRIELSPQTHEDIRFYVETEVKTRRRRLLQGRAPDLEDRLVETLTRRAQGMFRWAQLQLEIFFSPRSPLRHSKDVISKLDRLDEDARIPQLDAVYDEIYEMNVQQPQDQLHASTALKWIMCSQRALEITDLVEAVSIDTDGNVDTEVDATYVKQICSNLLVTDEFNFVRFAHLSVREYLMSRKAFSKIASHAQAAKTCLAYILHTDFCIATMEQFCSYAVEYWPLHCSMSRELRQQDDSLRKMFNELMFTVKLHDTIIDSFRLMSLPDSSSYRFDLSNWRQLKESVCSPPSLWFTACVWGFPEAVKTLLHAGFNKDWRNDNGNTGLLLGSRYGHPDIGKLLIESGVDIETIDKHGYTALHTSIKFQQRDMVQLLLENGASCIKIIENPTGSSRMWMISHRYHKLKCFGYNALHLVAHTGNDEIMRLSLEKDVDIDATAPTGMTALHLAARHGRTEQARLLKEYGACIDLETDQGKTAILLAAEHGHEGIVRILLDKHISSEDAARLLKMARVVKAIKLNDTLLVEQLLKDNESKDLNGRICSISGGPFGPEALPLAIFKRNEKVVALLLENGADVDIKTDNGKSALHHAVGLGKAVTVELLLEKGADIEAKDQIGKRPLHLAAQAHSNEATVQLLLEKGANIEAKDKNGKRALHLAAQGYSSGEATVQLLLENGANIEAEDQKGQRALHLAVQGYSNEATVQLLLENGANIEAEDQKGQRALHLAVQGYFNEATVQLLLGKGTDMEAEDNDGKTALDLAVYQLRTEVVQLLLEKGATPKATYDAYNERSFDQVWIEKELNSIRRMIDAWSETPSDYR